MTDPRAHPMFGGATSWQMRIISEIMRLPGRRDDPAYARAAASRALLIRGAEPLATFYDEVAAYYAAAPRLSRMHRAYRSRTLRRNRRG